MINTPNKTAESYNIMLAGVADSPLFERVCVCVYGGNQREGSWKRNCWLLDYQIA